MKARTDEEIAGMKALALTEPRADHIMVEGIRRGVLPASQLPRLMRAWEAPAHEAFLPRTAWSLFNAFSEVQKGQSPRAQMDGSLRVSALFRKELLN